MLPESSPGRGTQRALIPPATCDGVCVKCCQPGEMMKDLVPGFLLEVVL